MFKQDNNDNIHKSEVLNEIDKIISNTFKTLKLKSMSKNKF